MKNNKKNYVPRIIFFRRSNSFNISSRSPPKPAFPAGAPGDEAGVLAGAGLVANEGVFTAVVTAGGAVPGEGGSFGGGGNADLPPGGPDGGPEGSPEGGPEGGPDGGPEGGPDGGPDGGPEGDTEGGPEGDTEGGPEGDTEGGPEGVFTASIGWAAGAEGLVPAVKPEDAVSAGFELESILNRREAAFSRAATFSVEILGSAVETTTPAVPDACFISLTRFKSFLTLSNDF